MDTYHGWSLTTPLSSATTARSLFTKARRREILRTSRFCALRPNGVLRSSRRCKNVPAPGHSRIAEEVRVLRGGLALDALYLLARDVDRAGELVGPEHPAVDHILDLPRSEVQILGCLPQGDFLASFVFHPTLTSLPGKDGSGPPQGYTGPSPCPYSPECVEIPHSPAPVRPARCSGTAGPC